MNHSQQPFLMDRIVSMREATLDDYQDVMAIAEVYDGRDYLPSMYDAIVSCADNKCYVSLVNDEIVGFIAGCSMDDGETVVTRAGRVKDAYKRQGIHRSLKKHVRDHFAGTGRVKCMSFTTYSPNKDKIKTSYTEILFKNANSYILKPKDVKHLPDDLNTPIPLQKSGLEDLFSSEATCKHLFQNNRIVLNWVRFGLRASNIDRIITPNRLVLATCCPDSDVICTCLSAGTHFRCKIGLAYVLDVFGDDVSEVKRHVHAHLKNMIREAAGQDDQIWLCVMTPPNIDVHHIDSILCDLNIHKHMIEIMYIMETPF